jgi:hypothetical protein
MTGSKYTLQVADEIDVEVKLEPSAENGTLPEPQEPTYETRTAWFDVAVVDVPARTKSQTVLRIAAAQAGLDVTEALRVRLLPASVAEPIELLPPAPQPGPRQVRL